MTNNLCWALGALSVCVVAGAGVADARDGASLGRRGLVLQTGNVEFNLGGRLHLDAAQIDDAGVTSDAQDVRRARLELSLRLFDTWRLRVDREFAHRGGWRNVWLSYDANEDFTIKAGNFVAPFSMEDVGSSNDTMFMERSLAEALAPGYGLGVGASYEGRHFGVAAGYFGDSIDAEDNIQPNKGRGVALRATWSPLESRTSVLHFGVGLDRRQFGAGDVRLISSAPEASLAPTVITTGTIANPDTSMSYNAEAAYSIGPVLFQGQFISSRLQRTAGADLTFDGYYAQVGWIITGERHRYSGASGVFTGPRPTHAWGALEVAARVSDLDLSEPGVGASGEARDATFGVNWYIGDNVRLMGNYVHSERNAVNPLLDRTMDVVEARAQLDF